MLYKNAKAIVRLPDGGTDFFDIVGVVSTMFSCGPLHMDTPVLANQQSSAFCWRWILSIGHVNVVYTVLLFVFLSIWSDSLVFYLGLSITSAHVNGYKDFDFRRLHSPEFPRQPPGWIIDHFRRPFVAAPGLRSLTLANWPVLTTEATNQRTAKKPSQGSNLTYQITGYFQWPF